MRSMRSEDLLESSATRKRKPNSCRSRSANEAKFPTDFCPLVAVFGQASQMKRELWLPRQ